MPLRSPFLGLAFKQFDSFIHSPKTDDNLFLHMKIRCISISSGVLLIVALINAKDMYPYDSSVHFMSQSMERTIKVRFCEEPTQSFSQVK